MTQQHPALVYAESLGFQSTYTDAEQALKDLDELFVDLDKAQDERRFLSSHVADREIELLIAEQGKFPEYSATKLDQHMKVARNQDPLLRELHRKLDLCYAQLNGLEIDRDVLIQRIKIKTSRMNELGGYFNYLASVKQAETLTRTQEK